MSGKWNILILEFIEILFLAGVAITSFLISCNYIREIDLEEDKNSNKFFEDELFFRESELESLNEDLKSYLQCNIDASNLIFYLK